jgi:hypothetical protein
MVVNNLVIEDYFNIVNALQDGPNNPATVSFAVHWARGGKHFKVRDIPTGMAGDFVMSPSTMSWSASSAGQSYVSGPEETSFSVAGQVGEERNGVFFR